MRPFRLAPLLLSALFLQTAFAPRAFAQAAPSAPKPPEAEEGADAEEAPVEDEPEKAKPPAASDKPAEPPPAAPPPAAKKAEGEGEDMDGAGEEEMPADEEMPSDAEMEAEMAKELAAEDAAGAAALTKPPAKGKGAIVGVVTDTKFNESIIEAQVTVIGTKTKVFTDLEGRYRLELPPGTYNIRVAYELHQPSRVDTIEVKAGAITRIDTQLVPDESAVETVEIVSDADKTSLEGQTLERKRSASVGDGVGRAEIARTPDRNAAEAAQRVVGATIVGGRFVYVRGLGERYTNALLNGTPLPSTEPDRTTVPLDLFPSLVLDSITINKTFTPDMPADFAGGSVRINTRDFPRQTLFQISLNGGFNSAATFRDRLTYTGSSTDWLGFDGGTRQMPDLPDKRLDTRGATAEELTEYGRKLNSRMSSRRGFTPPNHGISIVAGDSFKFGGNQKLGVVTALNYGRSFNIIDEQRKNFLTQPGGGIRVADDIKMEHGVDSVRWGAFGSVSYEPHPDHLLNFTGLHSQSADNEVFELEGSYENSRQTIHTTHLQYTERALNFGQLRGRHTFKSYNRMELDWHAALAAANRNQPDSRDSDYVKTDTGYSWIPGTQSGSHFFSKQSEVTRNAGIDVTQPLTRSVEQETRLKVGGFVSSRERDFSARRFAFEPVMGRGRLDRATFDRISSCTGATFPANCSDNLFLSSNVRSDLLTVRETTQSFDAYEAGLDVYAGYGMIDAQISKALRAIGGARVEQTKQRFVGYDPFDRAGTELRGDINSTDVLPSASLVYSANPKTNTRFAVSQTLARPQLREIAPFLSSAYTGQLPVQGNPDLQLTKITNADLRFEYFPSLREVLAFSFFYKRFKLPIEETIARGGNSGIITYANAESADLIGLEVEGRKNLASFANALRDFTLIANVTGAHSRVELPEGSLATNASRPLSYQSPFIINLAADYSNADTGTDVRLLYNIFGKRITTVGLGGLPDIYEQPRGSLDLTVAQKVKKHFEVKLAASNLLRTDAVFSQGATVSDGDANVNRRYTTASIFTLTGTYTY
jgi:Outer membrane protein beta-barrel family/Carboxypeptidase regulatory-like domain/TonB-dependent Receptor Plug Domain